MPPGLLEPFLFCTSKFENISKFGTNSPKISEYAAYMKTFFKGLIYAFFWV